MTAPRGIQHRISDMRDSVKGFIVIQHQRLTMSSQPSRQEHLNTSSMVKILVIGETGSGKSTFINYLTNYFKKGTLNNLKVAIPSTFHREVTENFEHLEHDIHDKTQSKTDSCHQYMFTDGTTQYLFVDTPGLSDTRGSEQDKINLNKIIDAVESLAGLTAVIIVVNGAISRLTVNLRNVIAQLRGNLPDVVMDNVIVILTNSTRHTKNFTLEALELNGNVYPYYMQNSAFSTDPSRWTSSAMQSLENDWDQAMSELKAMIKTLGTFKTKSVAAFKNMKDIRNAIKALMHAARVEVVQIQKMQDEIAMFEVGRKQADADTVTYKEYTKERIVDKVELVDAKYHSTLCQNCNHVCHDKCGLDEATGVGAQIFQQCWAMSNGNCQQCQHRCSYTAHYHAKKTVKVSKQTLKDVLADIKSRYDTASKNSADFQTKITSTEDAKKLLERALQQKNIEIKAKCTELRQICSGFNLAAELHALIDQLEIESSMLRNIDARKQAEIFIRSLKEFCASIEKDQDEQKFKQEQKSKMNIIDTEQHIEGQMQVSHQLLPAGNASDRKNSKHVSNSDSSNSGSYASDEVLNQIRAISGGLPKKNEKQKHPNSANGSAGSTDEADENEDDVSEDSVPTAVSTKSAKKKTSKSELPRAHMSGIKPDVEKFKKLPVNELLTLYRTCEDQRTANFIINELKQRSYGKSMAPLTDPTDIAAFMTSTQKYCSLDYSSLKHVYDQLKEQICNITEPDILEIEKVSSALLYEIAAVYQLMMSASTNFNTAAINSSFKPQQTLTAYQQQRPMPYYDPQQPQPFHYQQQLLTSHQQQQQFLLHPQQQQPPLYPQLPQHQQQQPYLQGYPMGDVPYPPGNTYHYIAQPPKPSDPPPTFAYGREAPHNAPRRQYDFVQPDPQYYTQVGGYAERYRQSPIHRDNEQFRHHDVDSPIHYSDLHSSSTSISSHHPGHYRHPQDYQQHAFRNVPSSASSSPSVMPIPSSTSSASHLPDSMDKMRISSPFRPIEYNSNYIDSNTSRSRSSSGFSEINSRASSAFGLPFEVSVDELRRYTDNQLLSAYNDAIQKKNRSLEHVIYTELQRRCYGDHPLLINEKKILFDEKCRSFQGRSSNELQSYQREVQQKIRTYLTDNDASHLIDIPQELILEAAALHHLIKMETSRH